MALSPEAAKSSVLNPRRSSILGPQSLERGGLGKLTHYCPPESGIESESQINACRIEAKTVADFDLSVVDLCGPELTCGKTETEIQSDPPREEVVQPSSEGDPRTFNQLHFFSLDLVLGTDHCDSDLEIWNERTPARK